MSHDLSLVSKLFATIRSRQEFIDGLVTQLQVLTDIECVGIRVLNADGTLPYESYRGFTEDFWVSENCICIHTDQCVCIRAITGEAIPMDAAILSAKGSVWTNDLQAFGQSIPPSILPEYRGKCIASPFQTLGVITLRNDAKVIGLLHLADTRPDRLPAETITFLECIANVIGAVILRFNAEDDLRAAKKAAEDSARAKSEFLANTSHEIRTPMTVILGVLEHLSLSDLRTEDRELLALAENSAERLLGLIDEILDISRIEAQRMALFDQPFDLYDCAEKAVHLFDLKTVEKNLDLTLTIDPKTPQSVVGDCDRLGQILVNLVGNAIKFTERGGIIVRIEPGEKGTDTRFSVQDTGIGIAADKLDLVFENFRQADASLTRKYGGTGLGLAISRGLVELMGGTIGVTSKEGEGSTFAFVLPLRLAPIDREQVKPVWNAVPANNLKILLAEDDPMVREFLRATLAQHHFQVLSAANGLEALKLWESERISLILMDVQMPEMDGLEATRRIRERETGTDFHTPIIAITARTSRKDEQMCLEAGMNRYLSKPINMQRLLAMVNELCLRVETVPFAETT